MRKIAWFVIGVHALCVLFLWLPSGKKIEKRKQPLVVQTRREMIFPPPVKSSAPVPPKKIAPKKVEKKPPLLKKTGKTAAVPAKKVPIQKVVPEKKEELPHPSPQVPVINETADLSYHETLAAYLHNRLNLPEHGEVKIELTIRGNGSVARLLVLEAESGKNRSYLERHLPLLTFPPLTNSQREGIFVLTFCNEL